MYQRKHVVAGLIYIAHTFNRYQSKAENVRNSNINVILIYDMGIILKFEDTHGVSEITELLFMAHVAQFYFYIWAGNTHKGGGIFRQRDFPSFEPMRGHVTLPIHIKFGQVDIRLFC